MFYGDPHPICFKEYCICFPESVGVHFLCLIEWTPGPYSIVVHIIYIIICYRIWTSAQQVSVCISKLLLNYILIYLCSFFREKYPVYTNIIQDGNIVHGSCKNLDLLWNI